MYKKVKNLSFFISFLVFFVLVAFYYFSEKNIIYVNKSRSYYSSEGNINYGDLPTLKNDTNDIVVYKNYLDEFKKKRKKRFWEKLISNKR